MEQRDSAIERIEYKLLSLTYKVLTTTNLRISITSTSSLPFNFLAALVLHPLSPLLSHHHLL